VQRSRSKTATRRPRLRKAVVAAIPKFGNLFQDERPPAVHKLRLFVLDSQAVLADMLDACLADLILAFYPVRHKKHILYHSWRLTTKIQHLTYSTKLDILRPSLRSSSRVNLKALEELTRLRNLFAHRSFDWAEAKYMGEPLWRVRTLRMLESDVAKLLNDVDDYGYSIMAAKWDAESKAPDFSDRRFMGRPVPPPE
jgi:hypothetical protein